MVAIWSLWDRLASALNEVPHKTFMRGVVLMLSAGMFVMLYRCLHHGFPGHPRAVLLTLIALYSAVVYGFFLDWLFQQPFPRRRRAPVGYPCATPSDLSDLTQAGRRRRS